MIDVGRITVAVYGVGGTRQRLRKRIVGSAKKIRIVKRMIEKEIYTQLTFKPNGNISPCPYKAECYNCPTGCKGESYWCKRYDKKVRESEGMIWKAP